MQHLFMQGDKRFAAFLYITRCQHLASLHPPTTSGRLGVAALRTCGGTHKCSRVSRLGLGLWEEAHSRYWCTS